MSLTEPYGTRHACRDCEHWAGGLPGTNHAYCVRGRLQVQANAEYGCVFWVRATGADDELPKTKKWGM